MDDFNLRLWSSIYLRAPPYHHIRDINGNSGRNSSVQLSMNTTLERVGLGFDLQNMAVMQVNGNILIIILNNGKIIAIDLFHPESVYDLQLPLKDSGQTSSAKLIRGLFQDPTGTHVLVSTKSGDVFYIKDLNTKIRTLLRLKNIAIASVAWCPAEPERNTGEILIGTEDGCIYESLVEASSSTNDYLKREDKYIKKLWTNPNHSTITGLYALQPKGNKYRQVVAYSNGKVWRWWGELTLKKHSNDYHPRYTHFFTDTNCKSQDYGAPEVPCFAANGNVIAFSCDKGVMCGVLPQDSSTSSSWDLDLFEFDLKVSHIILSTYHVFGIGSNGRVIGYNRLNKKLVFDGRPSIEVADGSDQMSEPLTQIFIQGACCDPKFTTQWMYSSTEIFELKIEDEAADVWNYWLQVGEYEKALELTKGDPVKNDIVRRKYGMSLLDSGDAVKAAELLGKSTEPLEGVALKLLGGHSYTALSVFLQTRLKSKQQTPLQQKILASWLIEVYMEQLDSMDDQLALTVKESEVEDNRAALVKSFQQFVTSNTKLLDKETVYEIISGHGRRNELLYYATSIGDTEYVVGYWIRNENWSEALHVLLKENELNLVYRYASVLLMSAPKETVDTWMRMTTLEPEKLIPAILNYSAVAQKTAALEQNRNQAIRYLEHIIDRQQCRDITVNNTLVVLYAKNKMELELLKYLANHKGMYDDLFSLRTCWQCDCIKGAIYILSTMGLYHDAVQLALDKNELELAYQIADTPSSQPELRKQLWLKIAERVIKTSMFTEALTTRNEKLTPLSDLLDRCSLLNIEDILGLLPDFTQIDEIKEQVISSMERYNASIGQLTREMDESLATAQHIQTEMKQFTKRHVLVEPGEQCCLCGFPLATRWFYVFPCQHSFHFDCLVKELSTTSSIRANLSEVKLNDPKAEKILSRQCVLCSESRLETIDRPLVSSHQKDIWAI